MNRFGFLKRVAYWRHADLQGGAARVVSPAVQRILGPVRRTSAVLIARYEDLARRRPLGFSALTVALLMVLVFLVFVPGFDTNDDPVMNMIVAGRGCSLAPDEHMIFTNVLIGFVLKTAYSWFPLVPWYGLYLVAIQFVAHTIGLYCAIHDHYTRLRLRLFLCYFAVIGVVLLNSLQFTSTAFLSGQAGILLLVLMLRSKSSTRLRTSAVLALATALLVVASLIRREVFYPIFVLAVIAAATCVWFSRAWRTALLRSVTVLTLALVTATLAWKMNDDYYDQDPAWRQFYEYNQARIKFNDEAWVYYAPETEHVFRAVNWSKTDFLMLMSWFYDNERLYSLEAFNHIVEAYPWQHARITSVNIWAGINTVFTDPYTWAVFAAVPLFLVYLRPQARNYALVITALVTVCGMILLVIVLQKTPPRRVYLPIFAFPLALALSVAQRSSSLVPAPTRQIRLRFAIDLPKRGTKCLQFEVGRLLIGTALALLCLGLFEVNYLQYRRGRERLKASTQLYDEIARLHPSPDKLFVCWACAFPYEALRTFASVPVPSELRLLPMGWPQRTPHYRAMKSHFGIDDLAEAIYRRGDVHVIGDRFTFDLYQDYVWEHFGDDIQCDVRPGTSLFAVMQASKAPTDVRPAERLARPATRDGIPR